MLAISPLELIAETGDIQKLAFKLQFMVIGILNFYGMGADEGARGLKRLMPNMFQADRVLDHCEFTEAVIQKKRPRVIQNLLHALRFHPALKPQNKRDREDILWNDIRVELPCARLYTDLLDSVGPWGTEQVSAALIMQRYRISKNSVYKFLSDPPKWLNVEPIRGEGFRLTIRSTSELTNRAYALLETGGEGRAKGSFASFTAASICAPGQVRDGERNQWLVSVVLACKWKGIDRARLLLVLKSLLKRVPHYHESRSLTRELPAIVRSLYHHRSGLRGRNPELILPEWLSEELNPTKPKQTSQIFSRKGSSVAGFGAAVSDPVIVRAPDLMTAWVIEAAAPSASSGARPVRFGGRPGPRSLFGYRAA
ncbi:MAG TPA: hypothetical protein VE954_38935 [Oligoflexus sp.]|uniref:hypothetical protein n=1 Tax=Oligoflexus sp. TaxID=1971216 RepID=UPI002D3BFD11|nr:hypothetical protein [Oligoflexus sp.]HYX39117.1 hypothetical protein [Oligoflexus sp.]